MKYLSFLVLISLITAATVASASTITIGFDPPSIPNGSRLLPGYTEAGLLFSTPKGFTHYDSGVSSISPDNGSAYIRFASGFYPLTISQLDGSAFSLLQADLAHYSLYFRTDVVPFVGHRVDGTTVHQTFLLTDGINFNSFAFNSNFSNLLSVEVGVDAYAMDNVQIKPVPQPPALLLLLSGLSLLVLVKKKQRDTLT